MTLLRDAGISDLFFNHQHPRYGALDLGEDGETDPDVILAALIDDAVEFSAMVQNAFGVELAAHGWDTKELAADFISRL